MNLFISVAGWTLVHFVWQGALVALAAAAALRLARAATSRARYAIACMALAAMLAAPAVTARIVATNPPIATIDPSAVVVVPNDSRPAPRLEATTRTASSERTPFAVPDLKADVGSILPSLVAIWLTGVTWFLLRFAAGCWHVKRLRRASLPAGASAWAAASNRIAHRLGLRGHIHVVDSPLVDTPTVIGWLRPLILLPAAALANLTPAQVEAILAHELAHVRRHDFLVNLLQAVAETLLFYHPAVWWLSARVREEREHCCDDVAVEVCGDAVVYAEALTGLASWSVTQSRLALGATQGTLVERVRRILGVRPPNGDSRFRLGGPVTALVVLLALVGGAQYLLAAQPAAVDRLEDHRGFGPPDLARMLGMELPAGRGPGKVAWGVEIEYPQGTMRFVGFTGRSLIRYAYDLPDLPVLWRDEPLAPRDNRHGVVVDPPSWVDTESFDISLTMAAQPTEAEARAALRAVLEQDFRLAIDRGTRELPVYALVTTGSPGSSLMPSTNDCFDWKAWYEAGAQTAAANGANGRRLPVCGRWEDGLFNTAIVGTTMEQFAEELSRTRLGRRVVNRTGLAGRFDIELRLFKPTAGLLMQNPRLATALAAFGLQATPDALEDQLGLTFEEAWEPTEVLMIDRMERPPQSAVR